MKDAPEFLASHPRDSIIRGFATLRTVTDPRGHGLLEALEEAALGMHDLMQKAIGALPDTVELPDHRGHSRHYSLPEEGGYPLDDPKVVSLGRGRSR